MGTSYEFLMVKTSSPCNADAVFNLHEFCVELFLLYHGPLYRVPTNNTRKNKKNLYVKWVAILEIEGATGS